MSALRYSLFFLPIHHYTYKKYYQRHDEYVRKEKEKMNKEWDQPFDKLSENTLISWENMWYWPPWKFNDIVGYLEIGTEGGDCLTADVYLKRKHLPRKHQNRRLGYTKKTNEILYFRGMPRFPVRERKNDVYLSALDDLITKAKKVLKKRNPTFQLWLPPFDFNCIDFIEAVRQAEIRDAP